ncbi:MAG: AAA domain-containing protein [Bacteroidia bacterium]
MEHKKLIGFLKSSYEADNREQLIFNFFEKKVEHRHWIQNIEIVNGEMPYLPLSTNYAEAITAELEVYQYEKSIYVAALFLCGRSENYNKRLNAPLLLWPARIEQNEDGYSLYPDYSNPTINPAFFRAINAIEEDDITTAKDILEIVDGQPLSFEKVSAIERLIQSRYHEVETDELLFFPQLEKEQAIRKSRGLKVKSCAGVCVLRKSSNTVHILKELDEMIESPSLSTPLSEILTGQTNDILNYQNNKPFMVPTALNKSQAQVLKNAYSYSNSIVIGPPGTGKSYTIAALVADAIRQGKSILVTSAKNQAVDVVMQKIEDDLGLEKTCIRAGGKGDYKTLLRSKISDLKNGIGLVYKLPHSVYEQERKLKEIQFEIESLEEKYHLVNEQSKKNGKRLATSQSKFYHPVTKFFVEHGLKKHETAWYLIKKLEKLYPKKYEQIKTLIDVSSKANRYQSIRQNRSTYTRLEKALKARTIKTKEERFEAVSFEEIKKSFPVWLVNLSETANVLPLRKDLFDLVIIDEASQCDMATALPLLYRAKRAIICGDPKQLRHLSFLSEVKSRKLAKDFELNENELERLDFRNKSILDLALEAIKSQSAISFLNEHFRSHPKIIGFSNSQFYNGSLNIMTNKPGIEDVDSLEIIKTNGQRVDGVNEIEAQEIIDQIKSRIKSEEKLTDAFKKSIGVLSPFREQVNYLAESIRDQLSIQDIQNHKILIGTAHSFQGEERDVMYLSFCVDDQSHGTAIRHINKADVFNVSITRARQKQLAFYSISPSKLPATHLLAKYIGFSSKAKEQSKSEHDLFSKEVADFLKESGLENIHLNHNILGTQFDLVVQKGKKLYGIDLIGYPGDYEDTLPLEKVKVFKYGGHRFFPIPYDQWYLNGDELKADLLKFLGIKKTSTTH